MKRSTGNRSGATTSGERVGDSFAPAGGAGLRVLFSKRSGANLCIDYGVGRESHGFYLALQEAF